MSTLFIFDFDDTLALTDSHVVVNDELRLTSREFAKYRAKPDDNIDFSEFMEVGSGSLIQSTVSDMQDAIRDHGYENVFIVTARSEPAPVETFLKKFNLNVPEVVATSGSENKARWLINKLMLRDYDRVVVYEDCQKNIAMLRDVVEAYNEESGADVSYSSTCVLAEGSDRKALMLDRPTSHGGWPGGKNRSWIGDKPVADIIYDYLKDMKLVERDLRTAIRSIIIEQCKKDYYWGIGGSGIIFVCPEESSVFLQRRSMEVSGGQGQWGFPGGGIHTEDEERFYDTPIDPALSLSDRDPKFLEQALEEVEEECGSIPRFSIVDEYIYEDCGWKYKTFIAKISSSELNRWNPYPSESSAWEIMTGADGEPEIGWFSKNEFQTMDLFFGFTPKLISKVMSKI